MSGPAPSGTHTHADGATHSHDSVPLYRGYPARVMNVGRVHHGIGVDIPERGRPMMQALREAFAQPFVGITSDGKPRAGLFPLQSTGVSTAAMVAAAKNFLASLKRNDFQRFARQPLDSPDRRRWINAFPDWMPEGVWLADLDATEREAAFKVMEASLSARGFDETRKAMKVNQVLGEFINHSGDTICELGYFFTIFGNPSPTEPWGWRLMGYHLVIYCTVVGDQMVLTPSFVGAEMSIIDEGPYAGLKLLQEEQQGGLELASSLNPAQRAQAVLYPSMLSKDLPPALGGLDGRHLAAAGQDNRIIPFEGVPAGALSKGQREQLLRLIELYVGRAADPFAQARMQEVRRHLDETHFAWIGDPDRLPFYYRIHSPVVLIEFDHHSGVFLANNNPEPFHIHTVVRTPNGNDYGLDLLRQHYAAQPHKA
ncbi:MAG TPA: DUF3500 domain-containing protein [Steroidobacteraceae bacterium]|nr:DUF3500 domain-containing protein [Steroidobacteraceae bacterium]